MPRLRCANAPTAAGLFVQLSMRRQAAVSGGLPILDLLLPFPRRSAGAPSTRAHHIASAERAASMASASRASNSRPWRAATSHSTPPTWRATPLNPPTRAFSTSPPWRATRAIFNPQVDDDGKEMILEITPRAADVCYPPPTLYFHRRWLTPNPAIAPLQDNDQRLEPAPRPPNPSRERRLPRLPIPHEPRDTTPDGALQDGPARCGRRRGGRESLVGRDWRGRHNIHICR